jgi:hypothetical protein
MFIISNEACVSQPTMAMNSNVSVPLTETTESHHTCTIQNKRYEDFASFVCVCGPTCERESKIQ